MELTIDGIRLFAKRGESLLQIIRDAGLDAPDLKKRPLAAKIAGEVFTLNYVPLRTQESEADRPSIRRAMAASQGKVRLLRYDDPAGKEAYIRTAQFVVFLAIHRLWPQATAKMNCTLGDSVFISVGGCPDFSAQKLKAEIQNIVQADIPLVRRRVKLEQALQNLLKPAAE